MSDQTISTTYGNDYLVLGPAGAEIINGTAMLGTDFGTIKSAEVKRQADQEDLKNGAGNLRAVVFTNPNFELTMEVAFDATVTAPAIGAAITLPLVGVVGRVMPGASVKWESGKERGLSFTVSSWDSLEGAAMYSVNPVTQEYTLLDIGTPVLTATAGNGQVVLDWPDVSSATGHKIEVSADAGVTWTALATPTLSTHTHTLATGQTRRYRVRASNAKGDGPWSNAVTATAA